ncbi:hypothetical protein ACFLSZ_01740 [Candidatus Bipolaricaulota bacterium]
MIEQILPRGSGAGSQMVLEHGREYDSQWSVTVSIATKIGCSPKTLRK